MSNSLKYRVTEDLQNREDCTGSTQLYASERSSDYSFVEEQEMNYSNKEKGYIKYYRSIQDHWLFQEKRIFSKFEAWTDILLSVQFRPEINKILIKGRLIEVGRGQSIKSLETWGDRWNWNKKKVHSFFKLLEKDSMITLENVTVTTRLSVCNYDTYQANWNDLGDTEETDRKRYVPTDNNDKKDKKENIIYPDWFFDYEIYLNICRQAYKSLVSDTKYINDQQRFNPNIHIVKAIEKSFKDFWATDEGWNNKKDKAKKAKGKYEINWKTTLSKSIKFSKVYLTKEEQEMLK